MTSSSAPGSPAPGRTDGRSARWAGHREQRRSEFVDAALRAIAEEGPEVPVERIAEHAGVGRTRLYKYFTDATDLHGAIAERAATLITAELAPVWSPHGTPMQMISTAISTHVGWLAEHGHLYRHLTMHALSARVGSKDAITDVKAAIAGHLTELFRQVLHELGGSEPVAEPLAHGIVGLVESTTDRWLDAPERMDRDQLTELLTRWVWRLLDDALRSAGVELDPDEPLELPGLPS